MNETYPKELFAVADILPFWRWAVCPQSPSVPGIPFYSEKAARKLFAEVKEELPWNGAYLIRRRFLKSGVEVIEHYEGREVPRPPNPIDIMLGIKPDGGKHQ
jgi:hypothetical protein